MRTRPRSSEPGIASIVAAVWSLTLAKGLGVVCGLALVITLLRGLVDGVVVGHPVVVSAGTLAFDGTPVALWGVRVPTVDEMCSSRDGSRWACGAYAISALYSRVADRSVWCVRKARRRGSMAAQCYVGFVDVAQHLVEQGWATADVQATSRYVGAEAESRRANCGMWKSVAALPVTSVDRGCVARVGAD